MRAFFCAALLSLSPLAAGQVHFEVTEHPYTFSTYFEFFGATGYVGRIIKSKFNVRTHYDLYNGQNQYVGRGICQALSLGSVYSWGKDFDIYDANDTWIGMIDGVALTTMEAKFVLYNQDNQHVATAYMNQDRSGFILHDAGGRTVAHLKRNFIANAIDPWSVAIFDDTVCDPRLIQVFVGLAIDYQEFFKADL